MHEPRAPTLDRTEELFTALAQVADIFSLEMPLYPVDELAAQVRHAKLATDRDLETARAELATLRAKLAEAERERDEARNAAEQAYGFLWLISTDDPRVHTARKVLLSFVGKDGQRRGITAARPLPCGHPISLAAVGVETGVVTCEFCDTRQQRDDAVSEEARWKSRAVRAEAALAQARKVTEAMVEAAWAKLEELNDGEGLYRDAMKFALEAALNARKEG